MALYYFNRHTSELSVTSLRNTERLFKSCQKNYCHLTTKDVVVYCKKHHAVPTCTPITASQQLLAHVTFWCKSLWIFGTKFHFLKFLPFTPSRFTKLLGKLADNYISHFHKGRFFLARITQNSRIFSQNSRQFFQKLKQIFVKTQGKIVKTQPTGNS